jgi:hypothetical protein
MLAEGDPPWMSRLTARTTVSMRAACNDRRERTEHRVTGRTRSRLKLGRLSRATQLTSYASQTEARHSTPTGGS